MKKGRYIIEFGLGIDFHGQNVNHAAEKAVKDAVSRSCLCGFKEVLQLKNLDEQVFIKVTVAVTQPEAVNHQSIADCLPVGKVEVLAIEGGMKTSGLYIPEFGDDDDSIEAALACVEVFV